MTGSDRRTAPADHERWTLVLADRDPALARADESLLALGDGVIGVRGSRDDPSDHGTPALFAGGVYDGDGPAEHLLAGPWPLAVDVIGGTTDRHRAELDLRSGVLTQRLGEGARAVTSVRFVPAGRRGVVVLRVQGPPDRLEPGALLRPPPAGEMAHGHRSGDEWARTSGRSLGRSPGVVAVGRQQCVDRAGVRTVERVTAVAPDPRRPAPLERAAALLRKATDRGVDRLLAEHRTAWAGRWRDADLELPDDPGAELAVRFALFHLWSTVPVHGEAAVGARGLSGTGYGGHVFWDADVFVLPAVASLDPRAARAMLEYRLRRLPAARALARGRGLEGARFPWESGADGTDVTPVAGRAAGEWMPILNGQLEEHVVADVAWAACHYAEWAGRPDFLTGPGRPLVTETARYWASRIHTDAGGSAHIRRVIGPDEYHDDVDDNVFTNVMARWNLRRAADLEGDTAEADRWRRLAAALVDNFDATAGRHEQFTGFSAREPLLACDVGHPPLAADLLLGPSRTATTQLVKQPDVLMAHHLVPDEMAPGSLGADLDFYLPRTTHGSSLSPAVTAAVLARAGRPDDAMPLFDLALRLDLDDLTGMTAAGLHLATLGGVWQAVLAGFAGVRVRSGALVVDPHLPRRWPQARLRFRCLGRRVRLELTPTAVTVAADRELTVETAGGERVTGARTVRLAAAPTGWVVER